MYLYGAGGHAKVIIDILTENNISVRAIIDDNIDLNQLNGIPVIHTISDKNLPHLVSIGNNSNRRKIVLRNPDVDFCRAIAKSALVSPYAEIGTGSAVMQGAIVQSGSVIGKHTIINTRASVDHDCIIEDFAHIAPGSILCGAVFVGEGTLIGAGAIILPGVKIGRWSVIGAGSVVTKDIPAGVVVYGSSRS